LPISLRDRDLLQNYVPFPAATNAIEASMHGMDAFIGASLSDDTPPNAPDQLPGRTKHRGKVGRIVTRPSGSVKEKRRRTGLSPVSSQRPASDERPQRSRTREDTPRLAVDVIISRRRKHIPTTHYRQF
jgi:hypothetical protein